MNHSIVQAHPAADGTSTADRCERNDWCERGPQHKFVCTGPLVSLESSTGSGINGPHQVLQAEITTDGDTGKPELVFDAGGDDWVSWTPAELRRYINKARAHLTQLDAMADLFEAISSQMDEGRVA